MGFQSHQLLMSAVQKMILTTKTAHMRVAQVKLIRRYTFILDELVEDLDQNIKHIVDITFLHGSLFSLYIGGRAN